MGQCRVYEQDWKGKSGIYINRRKDSLNSVYVGLASCLTTRFQSHRWQKNSFAKGGTTSSLLLALESHDQIR